MSSSAEIAPTNDAMAPLALPSSAHQDDPPHARDMRERLVRQIETFDRPWGSDGGWDARVLEAMRKVPRHQFMPGASIAAAYRDQPHPIGYGQTISQPTVVALMTQALRLTGKERVLEIGTGSGYQAAVLAVLARDVYSIEIVEPLGNDAKERLAELGYRNVHVRVGDGYKGWPEHAPFDRIILTAAPEQMPRALVDQLAPGGIIVAPVGDDDQVLVRWRKVGAELEKEELGSVRFVPMVPGEAR
jgi:protein-L-isoaspartate(D-aspartate) O-methyltransferase